MVLPFLPDPEKLAAIRAALPATSAGIYLNTGSLGPIPAETHRAMAEIADRELAVGRASIEDHHDLLERMDEARAMLAAVGVVDPASLALTHSATDALNIATWTVDWRPGDRVVTTRSEHIGGLGPLYALRDRMDVELAMVELPADGDADRTIAVLDEAIVPGTRLVSLSHVTWTVGVVLPIQLIAELVHARGALLAVDGAQAFGAIPVDLGRLGTDFYAIPAQKWLLGPAGMGALYVAPATLERARSTFAGAFGYAEHDLAGGATVHPDARRFEASGYHVPSVVGLARSVAWLSMYVGWAWIHERAARLAQALVARLAAIVGVEVLTPPGAMATLVTFRIAGWGSAEAADELSRRTFAILRLVTPLDAIRASVAFFNSEDELERFAAGVELLAGHTPDSLPARRLAILGQD